ncbi:MAG: hypothetical protein AB4911_00885 [Oscillochloridaceae bacterium umkhey_bin13]
MASKTDFSPEEWQTIASAPLITAMYIAMADMSGPIGLIKEMQAAVTAVLDAAKEYDALPVIKDIALDFHGRQLSPELPRFTDSQEAQTYVETEVLRAIALVEGVSPADGPVFREWLYTTAERTAEASKEGGFLGFGGTRVSEKERFALSQLAVILGVTR